MGLVRHQSQHDEVGIQAIHAVPQVGLVVVPQLGQPYVLHDLVLSLPWHIVTCTGMLLPLGVVLGVQFLISSVYDRHFAAHRDSQVMQEMRQAEISPRQDIRFHLRAPSGPEDRPEKTMTGTCQAGSSLIFFRMKKRRCSPSLCMKGVPGVMQLESKASGPAGSSPLLILLLLVLHGTMQDCGFARMMTPHS